MAWDTYMYIHYKSCISIKREKIDPRSLIQIKVKEIKRKQMV